MPDYPKPGSTDRTLRSHGEQIRRIRTRIPTDPSFSVYQLTQADMFQDDPNGEGWYATGPPFPHLVKEGNTVKLFGLVEWFRPTDLGTYPYNPKNVIRTDNLPAGFVPESHRVSLVGGPGFNDDRLWVVFVSIISGVLVRLSDNNDGGSGDPYGDVTAAGNQVIALDLSWTVEPAATSSP